MLAPHIATPSSDEAPMNRDRHGFRRVGAPNFVALVIGTLTLTVCRPAAAQIEIEVGTLTVHFTYHEDPVSAPRARRAASAGS